MKLSSIGTRWAAGGLLAVTFVMGASLVLTSWSSYRSGQSAAAAVTRAQGETFLRALFALGMRTNGHVTSAELESLLERQRPDGLEYVALYDRATASVVEAGTPIGGPADATPPAQPAADKDVVELRQVGSRARLVLRLPDRPDSEKGTQGDHRSPPNVTIEFEPLLAAQLGAEARRALHSSAVAAAGLLLLAALFTRLLLQREAAERRFAEQRRLAALGEMSSVLAHELRNPLASLKGHAQLLVERLPEGRDRAKADTIVHEARRLEALATDLLDFSRSGPIDRREADPAEILRSAAAAVEPSRIRLCVSGAPEHWPLDAPRTRQVLTNLLTNAVEASPPEKPVDASAGTRAGRLLFTVRDFGAGLPPGQEHRLFEPFFTTRVNGTGLGLAVAHRVVEMHGGTLRGFDHPQGGAVFEVELPKA